MEGVNLCAIFGAFVPFVETGGVRANFLKSGYDLLSNLGGGDLGSI